MNKASEWFRILSVCGLGMVLFACSSNPQRTQAAIQPQPAAVTPVAPPENDLQTVHFALDSFTLSKAARKTLKADAAWLKKHRSEKVEIQGHCDERGSARYNMKLGEKRARAVQNYLVKQGLKASRFRVVSYGFDQPVDSGHDEEAWAKNRRAVPMVSTQNLSQNN